MAPPHAQRYTPNAHAAAFNQAVVVAFQYGESYSLRQQCPLLCRLIAVSTPVTAR
jgi:hypothetical protein